MTGNAALRRASPIVRVTGDVVAVLCTLQASPGLGVERDWGAARVTDRCPEVAAVVPNTEHQEDNNYEKSAV